MAVRRAERTHATPQRAIDPLAAAVAQHSAAAEGTEPLVTAQKLLKMLRAKVEADAALRDAIAEAVRRKATTPLDEAIRVHSPAAQGIMVQPQPQHHLECHLNRLHWTYSGVGRILSRYCINDQVMFSSWPLKQAHAMRRTLKAQARQASGRDRMSKLFRRLLNELKRPPVLALLVLAFLPQVAQ